MPRGGRPTLSVVRHGVLSSSFTDIAWRAAAASTRAPFADIGAPERSSQRQRERLEKHLGKKIEISLGTPQIAARLVERAPPQARTACTPQRCVSGERRKRSGLRRPGSQIMPRPKTIKATSSRSPVATVRSRDRWRAAAVRVRSPRQRPGNPLLLESSVHQIGRAHV